MKSKTKTSHRVNKTHLKHKPILDDYTYLIIIKNNYSHHEVFN